jgi:hypothetical protein
MSTPPRVFKPRTPVSFWIKSIAFAALALGFILFATWKFGALITDAKMTGTVVSKEHRPFEQAENQITLNKDGSVRNDRVDGDYILQVEVPQPDGSKKTFTVWLNDKSKYEAIQVGDRYDVGPALVR